MLHSHRQFPVDVRTGWVDYSPALRYHASRRVRSRLAPFATQIRSVSVRFADDEPQDVAQRRCDIEVTPTHGSPVFASSVGVDLLALVDRAVDTIVERLRQHASVETQPAQHQRIA